MKHRSLARPLLALALVAALSAAALADTIRLKDGTVIRGEIVGFRDQQFTVLVGSAGRSGRRSQMTLVVDDVESIEFDSSGRTANTGGGGGEPATDFETARTQPQQPRETRPAPAEPRLSTGDTGAPDTGAATRSGQPSRPAADPAQFFPVKVRVRADNASNGWTDSGLMVRRGQRLRITSSGRVSLGQGRFSTPTGLPRVLDNEKLMRNEPTGALIAVIGDDNDEFIFIGASREFIAPRDGRLFLGVNEGNLNDNTGTYDTTVEAEPLTGGSASR
ncbi:MAG TPA: hypothetical protein VGV59_05235 [Pyrinomonadaceae bacterium]|nr:hypothetical protein [Pyrinomonadaceae bacterium]